MGEAVFYDDSLPISIAAVTHHLGEGADVTYLRDGQGQLHVFVPEGTPVEHATSLEQTLRHQLGGYAPSFGPVIHEGKPTSAATLLVVGTKRVKYIERRFAGADWTLRPAPLADDPPRLVFYSIKGGVGRTTALTVLARQIAAGGGSVLCLDLDLEAPGLGQALLPPDQIPEFGALDWLTERAIQGTAGSLPKMSDLVGVSPVGRKAGRIDVIPAFGRRCLASQGSVLGKLSRCLVEANENGSLVTLGTRVSELITKACAERSYEAVLIDARAGLSEISAAPLLALGADILLFMSDSNQSFATYTALLSHLQRFAPAVSETDDWRLRLKTVRGRIPNPGDAMAAKRFLDRVASVFAESIYDAEGDTADLAAVNFAPDDVDAPHYPLPIAFDPRFQTYEPLEFGDQADPETFQAAFGTFTRWCIDRLAVFQAQ